MLIRHLRFFITLAEQQHFGRAAEVCNVTQPTLSQAIRKLESDLDLVLVLRGHRFLALTPEGEKVLIWGRQILADYDNLRDDLGRKSAGSLTGTLRLGVVPAALPSIPIISAQFTAEHPEAHIAVRSMTSQTIQKELDAFAIDGGITYLENEPLRQVQTYSLYQERYVLACHRDHALASVKRLGWPDIVAAPLCLLSGDMQNRRILDAIAASAGAELRPQITCNNFLGIVAHLRLGHWCAVVPHTFGELFAPSSDLILRDISPAINRQTIGLVLADRDLPSPMSLALKRLVRKIDVEARFAATPFTAQAKDVSLQGGDR